MRYLGTKQRLCCMHADWFTPSILLANASDCPVGDHATASTQHVAASSQYTSPNARG